MIEFKAVDGCQYKYRYEEIFGDIAKGGIDGKAVYRQLIMNDLWFVVYFVMGIKIANHPFVVEYCREVEEGPGDYTLDLAARGHFKTTIITQAEVIQKVLRSPEERIGILSYTRPAAKSFLRNIKLHLEGNENLKMCFPDVLYANPQAESPKWSEDDGIIVKRKGVYNEATVEAWPLTEGMPTRTHYTHRVYDDIETKDLVGTPETIASLKDNFGLSQNLKTVGGTHRVVATPYHHSGLVQHIRELKDLHGRPVYYLRHKPATHDGTANGRPVFLSQEELDILKVNEYSFNCMQLLDPTPIKGINKLNSGYLKTIHQEAIPGDIYKFMVIDSAGDSSMVRDGDSWAIHVLGVEPKVDEIGASNVYILDSVISPLSDSEAIETIVRMYLKAGMIMQVGVEKVGLSTTEIHVANALAVKGRHISIDDGSLVLLRPAGRNKEGRIQKALAWPLNNGKIHVSTAVGIIYRERLVAEMDKFPYWKDDGIDALSYGYDLIADYHFPQNNRFKSKRPYKAVEVV